MANQQALKKETTQGQRNKQTVMVVVGHNPQSVALL